MHACFETLRPCDMAWQGEEPRMDLPRASEEAPYQQAGGKKHRCKWFSTHGPPVIACLPMRPPPKW